MAQGMWPRTRPGIAPALLLLCACGVRPEGGSGFETTSGVVVPSTGEPGSSTSSEGEGGEDSVGASHASSGGGSSTGPLLDVGSKHDLEPSQPAGCKGKIDFLFVVSRAWQMGEPYDSYGSIQDRLLASAPEFLATIKEKFADFDVHVLVTKGDNQWGSSYCDNECPGPFTEWCPYGEDYPCELVGKLPACDLTWGAGVVLNAGRLAPNKPCGVPDGQRYITGDQANFEEAFACMMQVGASGYYLVLQALAAAVSPKLTGPGGCNEGFLRDDALLVVTFVNNMIYDVDSKGTPEEWAQTVLDAKGGDASSVVMLYIGAYSLEWCELQTDNPACDFIDHFPYRMVTFALEPTYGPAFDAATDLVADACAGFIPQ